MAAQFKYAIRRGEKNFGIQSVRQLRDLAGRRKIVPQDYVYSYERKEWVRAGHLFELFEVFNVQTGGGLIQGSPPQDSLSAPELRNTDWKQIAAKAPVEDASLSSTPFTPSRPSVRSGITKSKGLRSEISGLFEDLIDEAAEKHRNPLTGLEQPVLPDSKQDAVLRHFSSQPKPQAPATPPPAPQASSPVTATATTKFHVGSLELSRRASMLLLLLLILLAVTLGFSAGLGLNRNDDHQYTLRIEEQPSLPIRKVDANTGFQRR